MSIVLDRVTKRFGWQTVVDDVSLEIGDGELFVLLGGSGSGKSTILRVVAGLAAPEEGRVLLGGRDVTDLPPQERGTGFVFQNYSLFRHMTLLDNVEFGLRIRGVPPAERRARSEELLDLVELRGLGARYPDQLSGGQRQRVALARALAYEPEVLLLDEPFGALDARIRVQLRRGLRAIQDRLRVTTILVTHDQDEAYALADRIGVIEHGRLLDVQAPEALYTRPRSMAVATFLGSGAVLAGKVAAGEARFGPLRLPLPEDQGLAEGEDVRILVRPEALVLEAEAPRDGRPLLGQGELVEATFSGSQRRLRLRLPAMAGLRQVVPPVDFGEGGLLLEAVTPAEDPLPPTKPFVSLKRWHYLAPEVRKLLVFEDPVDGWPPPALVGQLALALAADVTVLGMRSSATRKHAFASRLAAWQEALPSTRVTARTGEGRPADLLAAEQRAGAYDLTLLPGVRPYGAGKLASAIRQVAAGSCDPTLVAFGELPGPVRHLLVCTAAGEPGKADVRFGGWLARRLQARVTLLYITATPDITPASGRHLERAQATLAALGTSSRLTIRTASTPAEGILSQAEEDGVDLIVVGGHGPQTGSMWARDDVALQLLARANVPVLVVPDSWGSSP